MVSEILVTGYDGKDSVFVVNLSSGDAKVVLTDPTGGEVNSAWQQASDAFATVRDLIEDIVGAPVSASS